MGPETQGKGLRTEKGDLFHRMADGRTENVKSVTVENLRETKEQE